ncbi:hypothetical protein NQ318_004974 [Aromia moschata]|uniref:Uncharacterized protein n=1 Tax=Aromia moschata TaxID=1265417 RepID=A0AAV8X4A1_9CUCU|nr:hypothetical protein NQ318_004974 [Aromia moschata]
MENKHLSIPVRDSIVGPFFINGSLNSNKYLTMLQQQIIPAVRALRINLENNFNFIFLQTGRWIGRGRDCPVPWPPRSPDLTTMDFYVWGRMKSKVYAEPVNDEASLRARILQAAQEIPLADPKSTLTYSGLWREVEAIVAKIQRHVNF